MHTQKIHSVSDLGLLKARKCTVKYHQLESIRSNQPLLINASLVPSPTKFYYIKGVENRMESSSMNDFQTVSLAYRTYTEVPEVFHAQ